MWRSVLRWMLAIVLLGTAGGGAYVYYLYGHSDELLRELLLTKVKELAPEWDVEVGRCRFNFRGEIVVDDLKLKVGEERSQVLEIPQATVVIDRDRFVDKQTVVQQVRLTRPQVWLVRDRAEQWNVLRLPPRPKSNSQVAEFKIEQATVHLRIDDPQGGPAQTLVARNVNADLVPSGRRRLLLKGDGGLDLAQSFKVDGEWNLEEATWGGKLTVQQLKVGAELHDLAIGLSAEARQGVEKLNTLTQHLLEERRLAAPGDAIVPAGAEPMKPAPGLGLAAVVDLTLHLSRPAGGPFAWKASAHIREGELSNPLLPFTLYDLQGDVAADPAKVTLTGLAAHNGETSLSLSGTVKLPPTEDATTLDVTVRELPFEPRIRGCLTGGLARIYDSLHPRGRCDLKMKLTKAPDRFWHPSGTMTVKDGQITHALFPLTVDGVTGTLTLTGNELTTQMTGRASRRLVTLTGKVLNPGPACSSVFEIRGKGLPIDERLRAACTPKVQAVFDQLQLQGEFDAVVRILRPAGLHQVSTPYIAARLRNCTVQPKCFPYVVSGVTAKLEGSGQRWKVTELEGRHDQAVITGNGKTVPTDDGRCQVTLHVEADGAPLDAQLQAALNERAQNLWKEFSPSGRVNTVADVRWTEKEKPEVDLKATFVDASMILRSFPYPLDSVQAVVALIGDQVTVESFSGRHEEMRLSATAAGEFSDTEWRVRIKDLVVDDLSPDRRLRKALPDRMRQVVETLDPRGRVSMAGMIELAGTSHRGDPVTAAWDLELIHSGTKITAGVDLDDLFGKVRMQGTWDGVEVLADGRVDLDSLSFRSHQLTRIRGPFSVNGTQLVIGSKDAVNLNHTLDGKPPVENSERLTANFIDGLLALDGVVKLSEQTSYRVKMTLAGGRLEKYAELYLPGQKKIMGLMNGSLDLSGKGTSARSLAGRGRLLISPAALYEVPILVAIFNMLKFVPPDKTAFRTAGFDFKVENSKFFFERIQLIGDAISLAGAGVVGFDGNVAMDFYSRGGRAKIPLPVVSQLVDEWTKGFVAVRVRGTIAKPQAVIQTMPQMDDALRGLLGIFAGPGAMRR